MKEYLWLCRGKEVPVTQQTIKLALEKKGIRAACLWDVEVHECTHVSYGLVLRHFMNVHDGVEIGRASCRERV